MIMASVNDIMNRNVVHVEKDSVVHEAAAKMSSRGISCLVIIEHGQAIGIITRRDILEKAVVNNLNPSNIKVEDMMSRPVITISMAADVVEAVSVMNRREIKQIPCVDDNNIVQGIITQTDIVRNIKDVPGFDGKNTELY